MKKLITLLSVMALVFAFGGVSLAETTSGIMLDCSDSLDPINRGCPEDVAPQTDAPTGKIYFDYNDTSVDLPNGSEAKWAPLEGETSYCVDKKTVHRAIIDVCACDAEWVDKPAAGENNDTINIKMEILVNDDSGNNGVYWAADVESIALHTDKCDDGTGNSDPTLMCELSYSNGSTGDFNSAPIWYDEDGLRGSMTVPPALKARHEDFYNSPQKFEGPFSGQGTTILTAGTTNATGYKLLDSDIQNNKCVWGIDIPHMYIVPSALVRGDKVSVKITLTPTSSGGLCSTADTCIGIIDIGTMCCVQSAAQGVATELIYPYMPKLYGYYDAQGIAFTNLTNKAGDAEVTIYEYDGDVFTNTYTVGANSTKSLGTMDFDDFDIDAAVSTGDGALGTAEKGYFVVIKTEFLASGLGFFANSGTGESMGYIPATINK